MRAAFQEESVAQVEKSDIWVKKLEVPCDQALCARREKCKERNCRGREWPARVVLRGGHDEELGFILYEQ